jgi:hypothetical protein
VGEGSQEDAQRRLVRRLQPVHEALARDLRQALVGIHVQHPFAADVLESKIPRLGEASSPRKR